MCPVDIRDNGDLTIQYSHREVPSFRVGECVEFSCQIELNCRIVNNCPGSVEEYGIRLQG